MPKPPRTAVLLLISLLVGAAAMPVVASAAPVPSSIYVETVDPVRISELEFSMIVGELRQRVLVQRAQTSWKCVSPPIDASGTSPGDPRQDAALVPVAIHARFVPGTGDNEGGIDVKVSVELGGKQLSSGSWTPTCILPTLVLGSMQWSVARS